MMNNRRQQRSRTGAPADDVQERVLEIARVTRVTAGGKRMRFRAAVVVGDGKGRVGFAVEKGIDVSLAVSKATTKARKHMITVPLVFGTIPHATAAKFGAARILLKPAPTGTGIKAGGAARVLFELAGIQDIVGKLLGSSNKINNARATMEALQSLRA
ncbi:MAG: 30S ribosomal protein S5, partial [Patescibacteria group bacterium]